MFHDPVRPLVLVAGFLVDRVIGDPPQWPHPVRALGWLTNRLEPILRRWLPERLGGVVLVLLVAGTAASGAGAMGALAGWLHPWLGTLAAIALLASGLAARALADETLVILLAAEAGDWPVARQRLGRIVGRDTEDLPPEEIYRAAVETVGENTCDGIVAPLIYAALLGPAGLWAYKAVSTLDSMVGYRNERYRRFGWAAARTDDLLNWLPARLTWLLLSLAAGLRGANARQALVIGWRDGRQHPSPNSGWGEATLAGALGVRLGGPSRYRGVPSLKPTLGDAEKPLSAESVRSAVRLMETAAWLALGLACGLASLIP